SVEAFESLLVFSVLQLNRAKQDVCFSTRWVRLQHGLDESLGLVGLLCTKVGSHKRRHWLDRIRRCLIGILENIDTEIVFFLTGQSLPQNLAADTRCFVCSAQRLSNLLRAHPILFRKLRLR